MGRPVKLLATSILAAWLGSSILAWGLCLFGTSDDGLHCVPAILALVLAPPAVGSFLLLLWLARRPARRRRRGRERPGAGGPA